MNQDMSVTKDADSTPEIYARYRDEFDKEDRLVNDRVNWLLMSQSILFAAVGLAGEKAGDVVVEIVPFVGCFLSVFIWISVIAAICSCLRYRHLLKTIQPKKRDPYMKYPQLHRNRFNICTGYIAPFVMPFIFIGAWAYMIAT